MSTLPVPLGYKDSDLKKEKKKRKKRKSQVVMVLTFNPRMWEAEDSQGYTEKPCVEKPKKGRKREGSKQAKENLGKAKENTTVVEGHFKLHSLLLC